MASPAPWLHWAQTPPRHWKGRGEEEEEEEEDDDDFEQRMDDDGVIGLGEAAGSPPWGGGEELEEGSPAEEGRWHSRRDLAEEEEEEEERGSSRGDEGLWGAESDGDPYPELSYEGQWGSESSGSPEVLRGGRGLSQPRGCSPDGTSGLSDTSPGPATPSRGHGVWDTAGDTGGGHRQGWTPSQSLLLHLSTDGHRDTTSTKPVPQPQTTGTGLLAPVTTGLAPTRDRWGTERPPAPRVPKKAAPTVQPPKPLRPLWSLSPQQRHPGRKWARDPPGTGTQYGRGRLNHPLPDLSKVEARVKIDQSYRPPRGRVLPAAPRSPRHPIGFKSPAEIVREVLLSSGEGVPPQPPSTTGLPQELRSPRQATALVQQLQDDYHKLLTKYAEAENTIDQLRLGARVNLYMDPPRPSHSITGGSMGSGHQVMTLSIPRARTAALGVAPTSPAPPGEAPAPVPSAGGGILQPTPHPSAPRGGCPSCPGACHCSGSELTQTLAAQTHKLLAQVESFESWMRAGSPMPREQLQQFGKLKAAQDALELTYLEARQQHPDTVGEFDPDRAVEGEIFHLGLRLESLKEQLESGAKRQPPPQPPAQPHSPVASSPPLVPSSLQPESPVLMEGPRGTAGEPEVVMGGLPQPLWDKQLQVEEDFSDLLQQYKHFKSLPESLSLEQLSLAESGCQEVDGPAAEDSGPRKAPHRTPSLEKDLETSPLHPPDRTASPLPPKDSPWRGGIWGCLAPATAEEPPATANSILGLPNPPWAPKSRHCSRVLGIAPQHQACKEQRIVSPETDSGFVGSEASRVSSTLHTPDHRPPGTGTLNSLGPSIPIPATLHPLHKREVTSLPPMTATMGICLMGGQGGTGGPHVPPRTPSTPSTPSQSSSARRWAGSVGSEVAAGGDSTHIDSEEGGRSGVNTSSPQLVTARGSASPPPSPETPSPTLLSSELMSPDPTHSDLLGSRLERDQAIRALRDEVWRLRRRLEESLRGSRSHPGGKASPLIPLAWRQLATHRPSSPQDVAPLGKSRLPERGKMTPSIKAPRKERSASLARDRPELELASKSDPSPTRPQTTRSPHKSPDSLPGTVTFQGQYTGTRYRGRTARTTPTPQGEPGTPQCPQCHGTPSVGARAGDATRQPQHSTPSRTRCPTCQAPMRDPKPRDRGTHDHDHHDSTLPGSHSAPRAAKQEQPPPLWYLWGSPSASTAIVPLVPYLLCGSPVVPTSAPAVAGVPLQHQWAEQPHWATAPHPCLSLDLEELQELEHSLNRAVDAAQSMRATTSRLGRALAAELSRARGLRRSCLF